jgi:hypothetical protein
MASIKRHLILGGLLASALAIPSFASADDATATPVATPTPLAWYQKITVGGYLDAYYQLNLNEASSLTPLSGRAYNTQVNQFTYGGGQLTLKQGDSASGTGYFVDLLLGQMNATYDAASTDPLAVELGEAYITQAFGNATFTLGKFATPIGYEGTYLPSDANFSRSLLYQNEPTFQTGLELSYNLPASLVGALWIDDGPSEDSTIAPNYAGIPTIDQGFFAPNDLTSGKGYGAQLAYSGIKNLSLTGTYYLADDLDSVNLNNGTTGISNLQLINGIASYTATSSLSFAGEYLAQIYTGNWASDDYFINQGSHGNYLQSSGYALYATWNTPVANLSLSPRFTQWFNPNTGAPVGTPGATTPYQLDDYTVTLKYQMGPVAHTLEYEATASNLTQFAGGAGNPTLGYSKPTDVQQTLTYAAIYSF